MRDLDYLKIIIAEYALACWLHSDNFEKARERVLQEVDKLYESRNYSVCERHTYQARDTDGGDAPLYTPSDKQIQ